MASLFRPGTDLMVLYATYHRDRRNIATHVVGIPMIVLGVGVLLARWPMAGGFTLAWGVWLLATLWYLSRGLGLVGWATVALNAALFAVAHSLAKGSTTEWLAWGVGLFVLGWVIQFLGHYYEGRKPAFADDLVGLLVGPAFVVAEVLFSLGLCKPMQNDIEHRAGPTHTRNLAEPAG